MKHPCPLCGKEEAEMFHMSSVNSKGEFSGSGTAFICNTCFHAQWRESDHIRFLNGKGWWL